MTIECGLATGVFMSTGFNIIEFLKNAVCNKVSDIHLRINTPPMMRKDGLIIKTDSPCLDFEDMQNIINEIVPEKLKEKVCTNYDVDFSIEIPDVARFRTNLLHDLGNIGFVFRVVPLQVPAVEELLLPPVLKDFTNFTNGLVLVTGPTGSGKSTTLASILNYINESSQRHIITLEDPIEFIHSNKNCVFTQRQLGVDTDTFPNGLKYALRQDPDVILIGEMRDRDTIISALKAAETGHLVFSTLHTTDAVQTINRIINAFEPFEREAIRLQIAATLRATVAQKLVKRADGQGRVPAAEILVVTPAAQNYIVKDEIESIYELVRSGELGGMTSMNTSLMRLANAGLITQEAAVTSSDTPNEMQQMLRGAYHGTMF